MDSHNLVPPFLGQTQPLYPHLMQAVRVTGVTVAGPSGGFTSSSVLAPSLYVGFVQQLHPTSLLPRDREACLVQDLNGSGLTAGYYTGRLAGQYQSLPIYEVGAGSAGGSSNTSNFNNVTNNYTNSTENFTNSTINYSNTTLNFTNTTTVNISNSYTTNIAVGGSTTINGPGYYIVNAPFVQCGLLFWCWVTYNVTTAQLNDWAFPFTTTSGGVVVRMTATADWTLTGISLPTPATGTAGNVFALANCSDYIMTIANQSTSSTAANRFVLEDATDQTIGPGGIALFWYDPSTQRIRSFRPPDATTTTGTTATWFGPYNKTFTDFSTAAFTNTINLTTPAGVGTVIHAVKIKTATQFSGGALAAYGFNVGNSRLTSSRYLTGYSGFAAVSNTNLSVSVLNQPDGLSHAGTDIITITATSMAAFLNAATAGSVDVWLMLSTPP